MEGGREGERHGAGSLLSTPPIPSTLLGLKKRLGVSIRDGLSARSGEVRRPWRKRLSPPRVAPHAVVRRTESSDWEGKEDEKADAVLMLLCATD